MSNDSNKPERHKKQLAMLQGQMKTCTKRDKVGAKDRGTKEVVVRVLGTQMPVLMNTTRVAMKKVETTTYTAE